MIWFQKLRRITIIGLYAKIFGVDSECYWNYRYKKNWELKNGRLQTAFFAVGFALLDLKLDVETILDYGCGCGDAIPVLKMKYPCSKLYYYDFSNIAMEKVSLSYAKLADPFDISTNSKFDLVYCSNVVEHIPDPILFCEKIIGLSRKYIVIQAPYNEKHMDGTDITIEHKIDEHVNTINEKLIFSLSDKIEWKIILSEIPSAWPKGKQIFFIGKIKSDSKA